MSSQVPKTGGVKRLLKEGGELLGIKLLDHLIVTDSDFYSFAENCDFYWITPAGSRARSGTLDFCPVAFGTDFIDLCSEMGDKRIFRPALRPGLERLGNTLDHSNGMEIVRVNTPDTNAVRPGCLAQCQFLGGSVWSPKGNMRTISMHRILPLGTNRKRPSLHQKD